MDERPNIIIVCSDQHNFRIAGYMGQSLPLIKDEPYKGPNWTFPEYHGWFMKDDWSMLYKDGFK